VAYGVIFQSTSIFVPRRQAVIWFDEAYDLD
jgi:hypothetical protein